MLRMAASAASLSPGVLSSSACSTLPATRLRGFPNSLLMLTSQRSFQIPLTSGPKYRFASHMTDDDDEPEVQAPSVPEL